MRRALENKQQVLLTYRCMVTPQERRSETRRTLLIISLPRLSKTRTFQIGSPSALRIGVALVTRPLERVASCCVSALSGEAWLRLRTFSMDAEDVSMHICLAKTRGSRTHLTVAKGVVLGCHVDQMARSFSRTDGRYCIQGWTDL